MSVLYTVNSFFALDQLMRAYDLVSVIDFNSVLICTQRDRFTNEPVRNRIIILPVTDPAVALYLSLFLDDVFIRCGGKFDHLIEFIVNVRADSAAFLFLKWLCVETI